MAKIRTGFVSNSSSSSFMLPIKKGQNEVTITIPLDKFYEIMEEREYCSSRRYIMKTKEDIEQYILSVFGYGDLTLEEILENDDYAEEYYNFVTEEISKGNEVVLGSIDQGAYGARTLIENLGGKVD
jgi:hypothetical protein